MVADKGARKCLLLLDTGCEFCGDDGICICSFLCACRVLSSFAARLVRLDKVILVGCMTQVVHAFHLKGEQVSGFCREAIGCFMQ